MFEEPGGGECLRLEDGPNDYASDSEPELEVECQYLSKMVVDGKKQWLLVNDGLDIATIAQEAADAAQNAPEMGDFSPLHKMHRCARPCARRVQRLKDPGPCRVQRVKGPGPITPNSSYAVWFNPQSRRFPKELVNPPPPLVPSPVGPPSKRENARPLGSPSPWAGTTTWARRMGYTTTTNTTPQPEQSQRANPSLLSGQCKHTRRGAPAKSAHSAQHRSSRSDSRACDGPQHSRRRAHGVDGGCSSTDHSEV